MFTYLYTNRYIALISTLTIFLLFAGATKTFAGTNKNRVYKINMTCFPPPPSPGEQPGIGSKPPCVLPDGIEPEFISRKPRGKAHVIVKENKTKFIIQLKGLAPGMVITAWASYYFPTGPSPHPIFDGVAATSIPLAPTTAGFTEGLGPEPNQFYTWPNGRAQLVVELDYNPLKAYQGPLRNDMVVIEQSAAPAGSGAEQPECCSPSEPQPIGSSLLRVFNQNTGYPIIDENGRQSLLRSPVPYSFIALVVHTDKTTHGIHPGIGILPIPGMPASSGDHFLLGMFDLRQLQE